MIAQTNKKYSLDQNELETQVWPDEGVNPFILISNINQAKVDIPGHVKKVN